jgi:hypothetical protein
MALSDLPGALALDVLSHALLSDLPLCAHNSAQYMAAHTGGGGQSPRNASSCRGRTERWRIPTVLKFDQSLENGTEPARAPALSRPLAPLEPFFKWT